MIRFAILKDNFPCRRDWVRGELQTVEAVHARLTDSKLYTRKGEHRAEGKTTDGNVRVVKFITD